MNKLELSLKVITDLGEALANLTKMPQFSTSSPDETVDVSWAVNPEYNRDFFDPTKQHNIESP